MKNTLYDINSDFIGILNEIETLDGEITPEIEQQLVITEQQRDSKSMNYLSVITANEGFISTIDAEIKRLTALKKVRNNLNDRLKQNLLYAVNLFGDYSVGTHKFGTRKSSTVEVESVNLLPERVKVSKLTESADKKAIKEALKSGEVITGCSIVENKNLKIY